MMMYLVNQFAKRHIPLNDIYVEILAESMYRIGDLWHTSKITVDMEHYCTSVTLEMTVGTAFTLVLPCLRMQCLMRFEPQTQI